LQVVELDYIHWAVVDIPPDSMFLKEGASGKDMPEVMIVLLVLLD
jgi:phosphatidylethanolamine-binding protein (PEBP) family uncharacterized protein